MQEICTASQTERQEKMEKLSNPQKTIEVIKKYDFAFQKKFGQNFLIESSISFCPKWQKQEFLKESLVGA